MKLVVLLCLVACAAARPQENPNRVRDREAQIISYKNQMKADGGNENSFEADNGIARDETIDLKEVQVVNENGDLETRLVPFFTGVFRFPLDDGTFVERRYYTDETGLHIEADDLPVAPVAPVP